MSNELKKKNDWKAKYSNLKKKKQNENSQHKNDFKKFLY